MSETIINYFFNIFTEIFDLYLNYNGKDFPKFHEARVKFNEYALLIYLLLLLFIIMSKICGPCCYLIYFICLIFFGLKLLYYLIISANLYFFYNGINIINNLLIHFFMWFSLISNILSFVSVIFRACSAKTNNTHSINNLEQQNNYELLV